MTTNDRNQLIICCLPVEQRTKSVDGRMIVDNRRMATMDALAAATGLSAAELHCAVESMRHMGVGIVSRAGGRRLAISREYWPIAQRDAQRWWDGGGEQIALEAITAAREAKATP